MHIVSMVDGRMIRVSDGMGTRLVSSFGNMSSKANFTLEDGTILVCAHIVAIYTEDTPFYDDTVLTVDTSAFDPMPDVPSESTVVITTADTPKECEHPDEKTTTIYRLNAANIKMFFHVCECGWESRRIQKNQIENPDDVPQDPNDYNIPEVKDGDVQGSDEETESQAG